MVRTLWIGLTADLVDRSTADYDAVEVEGRTSLAELIGDSVD